jgi:uncharacterized protein (UPF0303 family)
MTPEDLLAEERELQFDAFDADTAWALGEAVRAVARGRGAPVAIDITLGDQQVFHSALPGSSADNDAWVARKARVVRRFGHSSLYLGEVHGDEFAERFLLDPREFAAHGGCFPILVRSVGMVGTVTVSGLPSEEDHRLVTEVLRDFLGRRRSGEALT